MPSTAARPPKVQRWIDLIAALLRRHYPVSFDDLTKEVPAYLNPKQKQDARMRMFERDKDERRELGVPIESVPDEHGALNQYRLKSRNFYLPYLAVKESGTTAPPKPKKKATGMGYQSLPTLAFEPDELAMIGRAASRVQQMHHPVLAASVATAMRKLAFDMGAVEMGAREIILPPTDRPSVTVLEALDQAVRRRKRVEFEYWSIERNARGRRTVEPYGLVFKSGHWYLLARDPEASTAVRHFKVSRIKDPVVNSAKAQSADYEIPSDFDLWSHTATQHAWELGDGDAVQVTVRFDLTDRHAAVALTLGEAVADDAACRVFRVRRSAAFARWMLSFAGAARPVSPPEMVEEFRELARATAALYAEPAS